MHFPGSSQAVRDQRWEVPQALTLEVVWSLPVSSDLTPEEKGTQMQNPLWEALLLGSCTSPQPARSSVSLARLLWFWLFSSVSSDTVFEFGILPCVLEQMIPHRSLSCIHPPLWVNGNISVGFWGHWFCMGLLFRVPNLHLFEPFPKQSTSSAVKVSFFVWLSFLGFKLSAPERVGPKKGNLNLIYLCK